MFNDWNEESAYDRRHRRIAELKQERDRIEIAHESDRYGMGCYNDYEDDARYNRREDRLAEIERELKDLNEERDRW